MSFRITQKTLEGLEWQRVVALLIRHCRTPQARDRLADVAGEDVQSPASNSSQPGTATANSRTPAPTAIRELEVSLSGVRERLAETREARDLLSQGDSPPLGGVSDLRKVLRRAEMGGVLSALELLEVRSSIEALDASLRFLLKRKQDLPLLSALAGIAESHPELERKIGECLDLKGEVRDSASPALRKARREVSDLSAQLQRRLTKYLQDSHVQGGLSDNYYTVRNDRYVLPVRSDARSRVRGIVHDASRSGTTLFIEPEGVVELNNRLKQAELTQVREIERVLMQLSQAVAIARPSLISGLEILATIDLAFARGHLAIEMKAVEPTVARDGVFALDQLRHPLIPVAEAIPNDLHLGENYQVLVISGPNGGGKTVAMKAVGLAAVMIRLGLHIPAAPGARVDLVDDILIDIGDGQDLSENLSTFSAQMVNLSGIVSAATEHTLALLDEVGVGTDPGEGAALAQAILEELADRGARVIATTHYNLLKEMAEVDRRFCNASVEFDPDTLAPTFRLHTGTAGVSSATAVAARMGMAASVLERANALLVSEDRQLDKMLSELANTRVTLEREKREATRLRSESERARQEYQDKLLRLQERRDTLYRAMRDDLDATFKNAHGQVAAVIRDLQRAGDRSPKEAARSAGHARERLLGLERDTQAKAPTPNADDDAGLLTVDWRRIKPGDSVLMPGGQKVVLHSLPDRRGRVRVNVASGKLEIEAAKLRAPNAQGSATASTEPSITTKKVAFERADGDSQREAQVAGGILECDLRGKRVDEALDDLAVALDDGLRDGDELLQVIHGFGTGALRSAVREHLHASPHIISYRPGEQTEGGDGVTIATLRR